MKPLNLLSTSACFILLGLMPGNVLAVFALPPPEDLPEEVLRTEIITEARSPIDGKSLSAAEYAQLQAKLQIPPPTPQVNPQIRQLIFLLRVRRLLRTIAPF